MLRVSPLQNITSPIFKMLKHICIFVWGRRKSKWHPKGLRGPPSVQLKQENFLKTNSVTSPDPMMKIICATKKQLYLYCCCSTCFDYCQLVATILWHIDPLLRNDREISNYTAAVAKYCSVNNGCC
jgi:hypothetical protein